MNQLLRADDCAFLSDDISRIHMANVTETVDEKEIQEKVVAILFKNGTSLTWKASSEEEQKKLFNSLCQVIDPALSQPKKKTTWLSWLGLKRSQS